MHFAPNRTLRSRIPRLHSVPFRLYTQRSGELESQSSRRRYLGGSNESPPATVSSYAVVVSHLAFGTLSLRCINAPRWRRSWNVWISCSQDGPQGSQHLIRFSVSHFALAQRNPWGDIVLFAPSLVFEVISAPSTRHVCTDAC